MSLLNCLTPATVQQVPTYRHAEPHFETYAAGPSEIPLDSRTIDRITSIVAGSIGDHLDQVSIGLVSVRGECNIAVGGQQFFECGAYSVYDLEVRALTPAADNILIAGPSPFQNRQYGVAMVSYKHPIANIQSITVNRQRFTGNSIGDCRSGISFSGN